MTAAIIRNIELSPGFCQGLTLAQVLVMSALNPDSEENGGDRKNPKMLGFSHNSNTSVNASGTEISVSSIR